MNIRFLQTSEMRAGRLVSLILILQRRGRVTAGQLATELEVSERTILRDLEELSGAGVPVYATRGPGGGFQLLDGFSATLPDPTGWQASKRGPGPARRAAVRISPEGRQLAAILDRLQPLRVRRAVDPDARGWAEATFRLESIDAAATEILSLSPHIEVLTPEALRDEVRLRLSKGLDLHS